MQPYASLENQTHPEILHHPWNIIPHVGYKPKGFQLQSMSVWREAREGCWLLLAAAVASSLTDEQFLWSSLCEHKQPHKQTGHVTGKKTHCGHFYPMRTRWEICSCETQILSNAVFWSLITWRGSLAGTHSWVRLTIYTTITCLLVCYLHDADGFPGQVEAGVQQEGEGEGESFVPAGRKHKGAALRTSLTEGITQQRPPLDYKLWMLQWRSITVLGGRWQALI